MHSAFRQNKRGFAAVTRGAVDGQYVTVTVKLLFRLCASIFHLFHG